MPTSPDLIIGAVVGAFLVTALLLSSVVRNVALASLTVGILAAYWQGGVDSVLFNTKQVLSIIWLDIATREVFAHGLLFGAALAAITLVAFRGRKR